MSCSDSDKGWSGVEGWKIGWNADVGIVCRGISCTDEALDQCIGRRENVEWLSKDWKRIRLVSRINTSKLALDMIWLTDRDLAQPNGKGGSSRVDGSCLSDQSPPNEPL